MRSYERVLVSLREQAAVVDATVYAAGPPLHGVLHAGGVLADATLAKQTMAGMRKVQNRRPASSALLPCSWAATVVPQDAHPIGLTKNLHNKQWD
jgi:hypothetical protein